MIKRNLVLIVIGGLLVFLALVAWSCSHGQSSPAPTTTPAVALGLTQTATKTPTPSRTPTVIRTHTNSPTATSIRTPSLTATKAAASATPTITSLLVPRVSRVKVVWSGPYANCYSSLDHWVEAEAIRIPPATVLEVVGEAQAPVAWKGSIKVLKVKRPDGLGFCFIREPLVEEVKDGQ